MLVDHACPERLGELVRTLLPIAPALEVHTEAHRLAESQPGSTLVLVPRVEDVDWLNINRPLFASRALRVVLFCSREMSVALSRGAVDFLDWISLRLECPAGPAPHAVAGLHRALAARVPGIVWTGGNLEASFAAARPGRVLRRVSAAKPYEELVAEVKAGGGRDWLAWTEVEDAFRLRRVRWALAEARRRTRVILVEPAVPSPGWRQVHGRMAEVGEASERLRRVGAKQPGRLAALVGLEPEAVELLGGLLERGADEQTLEEALQQSADPRATLGQQAEALDVTEEAAEVLLWRTPRTGRPWGQLASLAFSAGDLDVARVWSRRAAGTEPDGWKVLVRVLIEQGELTEAEALLRHQLAAEQTSAVERAWGLRGLGRVLQEQGHHSEAEQVLRQALALCQQELGTHHPDYGASLYALARVLGRGGRYSEAEALFRQFLALYQQEFGTHHPDYGASLQSLASLVTRQGRYSEAEGLLRQSLAIIEQERGPRHPDSIAVLNSLALVLERQGQYAEAEALLQQALAIIEQARSPQHPDYGASLHVLAMVRKSEGRFAEAEALLRQSLAIVEQAGEPLSPDYAASLNELASVLRAQGRYAEAEALFRQSLAIREQFFGPRHPRLCAPLANLGLLMARQERTQEGEPFALRAVSLARELFGLHHPETAQCLAILAGLQAALKKSEAVTTAQQAIEAFLQSLGPEHPITKDHLPGLRDIVSGKY